MNNCPPLLEFLSKITSDSASTPYKPTEGSFPRGVCEDNGQENQTLSRLKDVGNILNGLAVCNSDLVRVEGVDMVLVKDWADSGTRLVTLEVDFVRFVARGMLTGAILEKRTEDVLTCLRLIRGEVLVIATEKETFNTALIVEQARSEGLQVDLLGFDARGIALVLKVGGALAQQGVALRELYLTLRGLRIASTDANPVPGIVQRLLDDLFFPVEEDSIFLMMVNSSETDRHSLYKLVKEVYRQAGNSNIRVERVYAGNLQLGKRGLSVSLLEGNKQLLALADGATGCQYWPQVGFRSTPATVPGPPPLPPTPTYPPIGPYLTNKDIIQVPLIFCCKVLICCKDLLNGLDVSNKFGEMILPAVEVLLKRSHSGEICHERPFNALTAIASVCQEQITDPFGDILHIFFAGAAQGFLRHSSQSPVRRHMWCEALSRGTSSVQVFSHRLSFTRVITAFREPLQQMEILEKCLEMAQSDLETTYTLEDPGLKKKLGLPEVSMQCALVILAAIVEALRIVSKHVDVRPHGTPEPVC